MGPWQLAQINVARLIAHPDDPAVAGFVEMLDPINALAEATDGFVWRLKSDSGNAVDIQPAPDPRLIVNLSVWRDAEALFSFVYQSAHTPVMARRQQWMERSEAAFQALWWVPSGHQPGIAEGLSKLWLIDRYGPIAEAFTFKDRFPMPGSAQDQVAMQVDNQPARLG